VTGNTIVRDATIVRVSAVHLRLGDHVRHDGQAGVLTHYHAGTDRWKVRHTDGSYTDWLPVHHPA
jgi:hypothetical protein